MMILSEKDIEEAYKGVMEVEQGDKQALSVGDATNTDEYEAKDEDKPYTDEDKKEGEDLF